ncbi:MAG: 16S rRNA (uracil(1498)-N(3))-methyltransferase [Bacteroidales bacterium]|jgi:16S rRNA (uracil1498-N3)-methyltransferase|nr:16S rRNA (uracil(1498)-N(3))-methyltransferase [Bacteroidales bacterium]
MFYTNEIIGNRAVFSPETSAHIVKVLRHKAGDKISFTDGTGMLYEGSLINADPKRAETSITNIKQTKTTLPPIHIVVAPTKNIDRIEWFVEKAVEVGIAEISFVQTKNSERKTLKIDRLHKIAESAMLQSKQTYMPKINEMISLKRFIERITHLHCDKFFGYCYEGNIYSTSETRPEEILYYPEMINRNVPTMVLIGPEGDFTIEEAQYLQNNNFLPVVLSSTRLRTETAALFAGWIYATKSSKFCLEY